MKNKLDPEGLGIILLGPFLQEFFPDQVTLFCSIGMIILWLFQHFSLLNMFWHADIRLRKHYYVNTCPDQEDRRACMFQYNNVKFWLKDRGGENQYIHQYRHSDTVF